MDWRTTSSLGFPQIYSISNQKEAKVRDLWSVLYGEVIWNLLWRRQPFHVERNLIGNLLEIIEGVRLGVRKIDGCGRRKREVISR